MNQPESRTWATAKSIPVRTSRVIAERSEKGIGPVKIIVTSQLWRECVDLGDGRVIPLCVFARTACPEVDDRVQTSGDGPVCTFRPAPELDAQSVLGITN